jgi:HEPN domain-containing protein
MKDRRIPDIQRIAQAEFDCSQKSYWRAATQRLDTAKFLIENSKYDLDSVYIAGYAAECGLKSLILKRTPKSKWADVCVEITSSAKAHNLDYLAGILKRKDQAIPGDVVASINLVKLQWTTNLRYVGAIIKKPGAENFYKHVNIIHKWVERSL